ncbi:MAG: DUF692 family protein [Spirochaetes bacterium]|nr:DUF692 family protein [Spirochaetota bacterium]
MLTEPQTDIGWFEAITENFIDTTGAPLYVLTEIRKKYPVALHGVALSIGSVDGVRRELLKKIRGLAERIEPFQISDHFCFSRFGREEYHELLPLPLTHAMAKRAVQNIDAAQAYLKRTLVFENISAYMEYPHNEMSEVEFLNFIAEKSGCKILLDINNVFVNATNFRYNARRFIRGINPAHVAGYHLAGFTDLATHLFDTHAAKISSPVLQLYREARYHIGDKPVSLERDAAIPSFRVLEREILRAQSLTPKPMPARYANKMHSGGAATRKRLKEETRWQKYIYSRKAERGERAAGSLTPTGAQKVYRTAHTLRHTQALEEKYFLVKASLGDKAFLRLAQKYIAAHTPTHADLGRYGEDLPRFLQKHFPHRPYLADLALLELARYNLYCQALDQSPQDLFAGKVRLSKNAYLWSSATTLFHNTAAASLRLVKRPTQTPQYVLLYRRTFAVEAKILSRAEFDFIAGLAKPRLLADYITTAEVQKKITAAAVKKVFRILALPGILA